MLARPDLGATVTVHVVRGGDELDLDGHLPDDDRSGGDVADAPTDDAAAGAPADAPADDDQGGGTGG